MNNARKEGSMSPGRETGPRRFPRHATDEAGHGGTSPGGAGQGGAILGRRFAPDADALAEALHVVRALDADSYQALLWALGLTPDSRLSVPGRAPPRRAATPLSRRDSTA